MLLLPPKPYGDTVVIRKHMFESSKILKLNFDDFKMMFLSQKGLTKMMFLSQKGLTKRFNEFVIRKLYIFIYGF